VRRRRPVSPEASSGRRRGVRDPARPTHTLGRSGRGAGHRGVKGPTHGRIAATPAGGPPARASARASRKCTRCWGSGDGAASAGEVPRPRRPGDDASSPLGARGKRCGWRASRGCERRTRTTTAGAPTAHAAEQRSAGRRRRSFDNAHRVSRREERVARGPLHAVLSGRARRSAAFRRDGEASPRHVAQRGSWEVRRTLGLRLDRTVHHESSRGRHVARFARLERQRRRGAFVSARVSRRDSWVRRKIECCTPVTSSRSHASCRP